jgi:hypothetical protein
MPLRFTAQLRRGCVCAASRRRAGARRGRERCCILGSERAWWRLSPCRGAAAARAPTCADARHPRATPAGKLAGVDKKLSASIEHEVLR